MHPSLNPDIWTSAVTDREVMVADGQQVKIAVRGGKLSVYDGVPGQPRQRYIPRLPREVTRLIILARRGYITLEALRWLDATRTQVTALTADSVIMSNGNADGDWRIVKRQIERDQAIARYLLSRKVYGQADTLGYVMMGHRQQATLRALATQIEHGFDADEEQLRGWEGKAADIYWQAWAGSVAVAWSPGDYVLVPAHWHTYPGRPSLARQWVNGQNRYASDPVNAMLNYAYKVLESETRIACQIYGFHQDIGIFHGQQRGRHAFVLDLMEPARPFCDMLVLQLIARYQPPSYFDRRWCHEQGDGQCMLDPPLTHEVAGWAADIGAKVREYASVVREMVR